MVGLERGWPQGIHPRAAPARGVIEMVEAATSADAKPAASTKTRPDDDDEDGAGALARLG